MKLIYYSAQTLPKNSSKKNSTPTISFGKSGTITFNQAACDLMEVGDGIKVTIAKDEDEPLNWYAFIDKDHGFELRTKDPTKDKSAVFNHTALKNTFLEALELTDDCTHRFLIGGTPTVIGKNKYWGILCFPK